MKIGVTERGDAGINLAWKEKADTVDGMILITKNITDTFAATVLDLYKRGYKIVLHCTCTGYGSSALEPNVPDYRTQLNSLCILIRAGFPAENCVLRIDPIFPTEKGLKRVQEVLFYFATINCGVKRIRVSLVDEYRHVKARYRAHGWTPVYGDDFGPSHEQIIMTAKCLNDFTEYTYEVCAENALAKELNNVHVLGCVSEEDLKLMGLPVENMTINPQHRNGCHCLSCKTELLTDRKPCPHQCVYCFWKQSGE